MHSCNGRLLALLVAVPFAAQAQDSVELALASVPDMPVFRPLSSVPLRAFRASSVPDMEGCGGAEQ